MVPPVLHIPPIILPPPPDVPFYLHGDFWVSVGTMMLAAITGWLAWETRRLRTGADQALAATRESIRQQAEATRMALRPYVTVDEIRVRDRSPHGNPMQVAITVINSGQTPARHLEVLHRAAVLPSVPQNLPAGVAGFTRWAPTDIGRDQRRTTYCGFVGKDEVLDRLLDGQGGEPRDWFIVYGTVQYRDTFSEDDRKTDFCFVWDNRLAAFYPIGPMNSLS